MDACVNQAGGSLLLLTPPVPLSPGNTVPISNPLDECHLFLNFIQMDPHRMCPRVWLLPSSVTLLQMVFSSELAIELVGPSAK